MDLLIEITSLTEADAPVVAEFIFLLLDEFAPGAGTDRLTIATATQEVLPLKNVSGFLATLGSTPIGVVLLNECAAVYAGGKFGEISELYVRPEHRSKGVAAKLLDASVKHAKQLGWKRLEVGAPAQPAWERTLKFYLREGFEEVGPRLRKLIAQ